MWNYDNYDDIKQPSSSMMVMVKESSPLRVMGRWQLKFGFSCSVTLKVSLYSCTVSLRMLMFTDPDSDPLAIITEDVRLKSDPTIY